MLNMKLDNFRFYIDDNGVEDRTKGSWEFRMEKVPSKGLVIVPSNRISFDIGRSMVVVRKGRIISSQKRNMEIQFLIRSSINILKRFVELLVLMDWYPNQSLILEGNRLKERI